MEQAKRLPAHKSVGNIPMGTVERIRLQLAQTPGWGPTDKWKLDAPVEDGHVLRITRELAEKPEEEIEINHVTPWKRRQTFLYDTKTGKMTLVDGDDDDDSGKDGNPNEEIWHTVELNEAEVSGDKAHETSSSLGTEHSETVGPEFAPEVHPATLVANNRAVYRHGGDNTDLVVRVPPPEETLGSPAGQNASRFGDVGASFDGRNLHRRVTVLERKERFLRQTGTVLLGILAVVLVIIVVQHQFQPVHHYS
ncbi:Uncharacterized protein PBTT_05315 [Plasmodiophora brassicae]